ncbi:MAG: isoaspartyl peptidase/L-asparaginase [Bacteroidota bacterium]|nr:isoaspartyl peptidase/L-asparaginase [Bacteroidota bacterium]
MSYTISIHGGAGTILRSELSSEKEQAYSNGLMMALQAAEDVLSSGGAALDAVTVAVSLLEDNPLFNAGKGSVFTNKGRHEMDASIMEGNAMRAGAVAGVTGVKNPVQLARLVMEKTDHVLLSGAGAEELAQMFHLPFEAPDYFFDSFRHNQWLAVKDSNDTIMDHSGEKKFGTVGAVARDEHGNLAAATSTGGMTNKRYNRIGDTPIIGSGTYANNATCAISCTGHGEYFIRGVVAYDVSCLMEYKGLSLREACEKVVMEKLVALGGEGGLIAVDAAGNTELVFNSDGMYRASVKSGSKPVIAIYR